MTDQRRDVGSSARPLDRCQIGMIALFFVLVYGFAALVTGTAKFTSSERLPLVYFLILFPVLVLGVFSWLVTRHSDKFITPRTSKVEDDCVKMQMAVVSSLTAATVKGEKLVPASQLFEIVETVRAVAPATVANSDVWRNHILWVDHRPENNWYERQAFEAVGLRFTLALSSREAFERLSKERYAAIISDMGRREGLREGHVLLDRLREEDDRTPLFFYAGSNASEHKRETHEHGGQGCTNIAHDLFVMVTTAVNERQIIEPPRS